MKDIRTVRMEVDSYYRANIEKWFKELISQKKEVPEGFPIHLYLDAPQNEGSVAENKDQFLAFCRQWDNTLPAGHVVYVEKNFKDQGPVKIPVNLVFNNVEEIAKWSGHLIEYRCAEERLKILNEQIPELLDDALKVVTYISNIEPNDFKCLIGVCKWLLDNYETAPHFIREIPVRGADLKWFEINRPLLIDLLQDKLNLNPARKDLLQFGLIPPPQLIRIYILDHVLKGRVGGMTVVASTANELNKLNIKPIKVIFMESIATAMTLPEIPGTVVVVPPSGSLSDLAKVSWIVNAQCSFVASIELRSFILLHNLRVYLPNTKNLTLNEQVLFANRDLWTFDDNEEHDLIPSNLTMDESKLCFALRNGYFGNGARLDVDRIPLDDIIGLIAPKTISPLNASSSIENSARAETKTASNDEEESKAENN